MGDIFSSNKKELELSGGTRSFKDCPNKCIDGYYIDPYKHKRVLCPYCESKRKEFVREGIKDKISNKDIIELLNLPKSYTGDNLNLDIVFAKNTLALVTESSVADLKSFMQDLYNKISIGELPNYSILFNLGKDAFESNFITPFMIRAYISGVSVAPFSTPLDIINMRNKEESGLSQDISFSDLVNYDLCIILIDAGATFNSIMAVKGLMQLRAYKCKPTLIFTKLWTKGIFDLFSNEDDKSYSIASLFSVEYVNKDKEDESLSQPNKGDSRIVKGVASLSSSDYRNLMSSRNTF